MSKPSVRIRPFARHEWMLYRHLRLSALADCPEAFGRTLAEEQGYADATWVDRLTTGVNSRLDYPLVAEADNAPVGLAWFRIEVSDPTRAMLYQMWVAPDHRRQGIGQKLLEVGISWALANGVDTIELDVSPSASSALRLYTRLGFKPLNDTGPMHPGSEFPGQRLRLDLPRVQD